MLLFQVTKSTLATLGSTEAILTFVIGDTARADPESTLVTHEPTPSNLELYSAKLTGDVHFVFSSEVIATKVGITSTLSAK